MTKSKARKGGPARCLLIAGPNGAGKTTFAREYLPNDARVLNFINADLIAAGLSPLRPELAAVASARLVLEEIARLVALRADFAWESTLSGLTYATRIRAMKQIGYHVEIIYLRLASPQLALRRIAGRVRQGGHNVQRMDVLRRFGRSWINFETVYRPLADSWAVYDNSSRPPKLVESGP
jgi:predicted ABC-type ATPase